MQTDSFFVEYTSPDAILKYTKATAGAGISYLLDHDYKDIYLEALGKLPADVRQQGVRMLEFGCGAGMNLIHLVSILARESIRVESAVGADFSPVLIEAANREAQSHLGVEDREKVKFVVGKNETLVEDLSAALNRPEAALQDSFDFICGVNTFRYCHRAKRELDCAQAIFKLLAPGGMCVMIDMNDRFPAFRSDLRNRFRSRKEEECYLPSLEEYTTPFAKAGFEILRNGHFCWIPHSAGGFMCRVYATLTPVLNLVAGSRAMRSLVVCRKPISKPPPKR